MLKRYKDKYPEIDNSAFIADNASIIGDVTIGEKSSIWFNAVLRGDGNKIIIGKGSNIQDNCTLHINEEGKSLTIGNNVTVGHGVILHGCSIESNSLIGMGAIILDGAEIGQWTIIGAGCLVPGNKKIPSGVLCLGSPAKVVRELTETEKEEILKASEHYVHLSEDYK